MDIQNHTPDQLAMTAVIDEWLTTLDVEGRKVGTVVEHRNNIRRFATWLDAKAIHWQVMTKVDMRAFITSIATVGISHRANQGSTIRVFYDYASLMDYPHLSPHLIIRTPKKGKPLPRALSRTQIRRLLAYLVAQSGQRARRDHALIVAGLYTGARSNELAALRWSDIDFASECVTIRDGKTGGRSVALHSDLADLLTQWQQIQHLRGDVAVFSLDGTPICPNRVGKICRRISKQLGFVVHAHALRHSAATWAIRSGAGLWNVSRMLGHSNTSHTSKVYLDTDPADSKPAVDSLPGLGAW